MARFVIEFNTSVKNDLEWIDKKYHASIKNSILEQLLFQPNIETKNRKPLDPTIQEASWELRSGEQNRYRVLYRFTLEENSAETEILGIVLIIAIGEKKGNKLWIGGEEQ